MNIYVSNLSAEITEYELKQVFTVFGEVTHVVIADMEAADKQRAGRYGYVEMAVKLEGTSAVNHLNGTAIKGRIVNVIEALPLSNRKMRSLSPKPRGRVRWTSKLGK